VQIVGLIIYISISSIWNKEELPEEWMESITATLYKKSDERECSNYRGISLSTTTYTILEQRDTSANSWFNNLYIY